MNTDTGLKTCKQGGLDYCMGPHLETRLLQLRKAFHNQSMELRKLRSQLASKEKKIRELESQLQLQESSNGC